jgi:tetratricopeptide (TPR) repeat protein
LRATPEIPEALDALVMELMDQDPAARPANAAEVSERLRAIANLPSDEQLLVAQAYLSAPTLVGREAELGVVRESFGRVAERCGSSLLIRGSPGAGRSRLLEACILQGKLAGAVTIRADGAHASGDDYGVVRTLAALLLRLLPDVAFRAAEPFLATLGGVIPELLERTKGVVSEVSPDAQEAGKRIQPALRQWLSAVSRKQPIVIAVDDLHRIDEGSAAFLSLFSNEVSNSSVVLVSTMDTRSELSAHRRATLGVLADASAIIELEPVSAVDAEHLLGSIFGDQPNLASFAHRLFGIAGGNPRDLMRLAQHLVDKGVLRYAGGTWALPEAIDTVELPSSMAQALVERVAALDVDACSLAQSLALAPEERFTFEECLLLAGHGNRGRLSRSLDELIAREVVPAGGQDYRIGMQGWSVALQSGAPEAETAGAHLALATVFERRKDGFRAARHLVRAGSTERGIDAFVSFVRRSEEQTNANAAAFVELLRSLPSDWFATYEACFDLAVELGRPHGDIYAIRSRLSGVAAMIGSGAMSNFEALFAVLNRDCGLEAYASLDAALEPGERIKRAMGAAWQLFNETPEKDRAVDPGEALRHLATALIDAIGLLTIICDYATWKKLPSLQPFAPVAPALHIVHQLVLGAGARIAGRTEQCLQIYRPLLERISQPDRTGLSDAHYRHMRLRVMGAVCMLEATMGCPPNAGFMKELEADAFYESSAVLVRMVTHVWRGDVTGADLCRREVTFLQIRSMSRQMTDGTHLQSELVAYALMDDLTRVKRTIDSVEALAKEYVGWRPVLHYGRGEYHRIRGDHITALDELDAALVAMEPGCHRAWPAAAGARVATLLELGRVDEARAAAAGYLLTADAAQVGYTRTYIELPLCMVLAKSGENDAAGSLWEKVAETYAALGITGLNLAVAHRVRARVALEANDRATFEKHVALAHEHVRAGGWIRREKLARRDEARELSDVQANFANKTSHFSRALDGCKTAHEKIQRGLEVLLSLSEATSGFIIGMTADGPTCCARVGDADAELERHACEFLLSQLTSDENTGDLETSLESGPWGTSGASESTHVPVLLSHRMDSGVAVSGVAVLRNAANAYAPHLFVIAAELSRHCQRAGDLAPAVLQVIRDPPALENR